MINEVISNLTDQLNTMREARLAARFAKRFPGPYTFCSGNDGVDATFDVFCVTTNRHIVSTRYWEARDEAMLVAKVATAALEIRRDFDHPTFKLTFDEGARFQETFRGPFSVISDVCEMSGPFFDIRCTRTGHSVIQVYGSAKTDKMIADYLALSFSCSRALPVPTKETSS